MKRVDSQAAARDSGNRCSQRIPLWFEWVIAGAIVGGLFLGSILAAARAG